LSELLVRAGDAGPEYLAILGKGATFKITDFRSTHCRLGHWCW